MASLYVPSRIGSPTGNGYKLYFYETGTTTPLDTFSQSDLAPGHENTNPVVADSNGLFGPIYLKATPDYKAVLFPSNSNTYEVFRLKVNLAEPLPNIDKLFAGNTDVLK